MRMYKFFLNKSKLRKYLLIIIPVFLSFLYFYVIARDRYLISSELVIRKARDNFQTDLNFANILGSGNFSSREDAKFLQSYLKSPQMLDEAEKKLGFLKNYRRELPDLISGLSKGANKNEIFQFFRKVVKIQYKESSNILQINVIGYDPKTAYELNSFLVINSENFSNALNQDVFKRQLNFVSDQVQESAKNVEAASKELLDFQRLNIILDPKIESQTKSSYLSALESELVKLKVDLAMLKRRFVSLDVPEILDISNQILELSAQIKEERINLVNPRGDNLNLKILKVSELENKLKFALDLYKAAITTYEKTRINSLQQQRFIAIISEPFMPEEPSSNWRSKGFFSSLAILLLIAGLYNFLNNLAFGRRN